MERGIKFARILARVLAPQTLIDNCVAKQGQGGALDQSYAIDDSIRCWLEENLLDGEDESILIPVETGLTQESLETGLPRRNEPLPLFETVLLPSEPTILTEDQLPDLITRYNFFESRYNPQGVFPKVLVDNGDNKTVIEMRTGLMWQRTGCDITSIKSMQAQVVTWNQERFAGHGNWRLPTIEEALSLLEPKKNEKGLYLSPCFSIEQPFIFLANDRRPGGRWYIDFMHGTVFQASGTNPGGFGRCCRSLV